LSIDGDRSRCLSIEMLMKTGMSAQPDYWLHYIVRARSQLELPRVYSPSDRPTDVTSPRDHGSVTIHKPSCLGDAFVNSEQGSVSHWIGALKVGDSEAAQHLWERYFDALVRLARAKLGASPRGESDEEDIALSAFHSFCQGAARGRF